ncbi:MAG: membrane dipeptidase [Phycisphaeraceae bacterium]|nr:membrane dipeptidase [Phycisphaeraceae bacterium]
MMKLFDAHLDMALNALDHERDQTLSVSALREREAGGVVDGRGIATVSVDELKQGGCGVVLSTVIARSKPWVKATRENIHDFNWPDPSMAYGVAMGQLAYYRLLQTRGQLRILESAGSLKRHLAEWGSSPGTTPVGLVLTMEGADPIVEPEQLRDWHAVGLRTLMLAHFGKSHYAHGTPAPESRQGEAHDTDGPLTDRGRALLPIMHELGMPLDLTHTADQSFAEAADLFEGRIYSSHTACRAIAAMPRNHTDAQLKQIIERDGVIGLPLFNHFLNAAYEEDSPKEMVTYAYVADHIDHICQLAGSAKHVGIGSDADGGFGKEHMPAELDTHRDIVKLAEVLSQRGYSDDDIVAVMRGNWINFFSETLP